LYIFRAGLAGSWTADAGPYVSKQSNTISNKFKSGELIPSQLGVKLSDAAKEKLSINRIAYLESNHNYGLKWYSVFNGEKDIKVQGTWELRVANWLNENSILWDRTQIKYGVRRYTQDFHLIDYNMYIEVKGYMKDRDICKMYTVLKTNDIDIRLIEKNDIKKLNNIHPLNLSKFTDRYKESDINFYYVKVKY
jgi:hypothetical protein